MALNFKMDTRKKKDNNIEICLSGDFDGMSAWELIHKINEYSECCDLIELNTHGLKDIIPFGRRVFEVQAKPLNKSRSRYVVTGPGATMFSECIPVYCKGAM